MIGLEENPQSFLSPGNLFTSDENARLAVVGVYAPLMGWNGWKQPAQHVVMCDDNQMFCWDWMAGGPRGDWASHWTLQNNSVFQGNYQIIERANQILEYVPPAAGISETGKRTFTGQAYFARGYAYFDLVRRFGGVPIRTESYKPDSERGAQARNSVDEVFIQAASDLREAAARLPTDYATANGRGLPRAASAWGLLAKVYLHMAGDEATGTPLAARRAVYLDSARIAAQNAISDPSVGLESNYMALFNPSTQKTSNEILFAVQGGRTNNYGSNVPPMFGPRGDRTLVGGGGEGFVSVRLDFYNTFAPNDKRIEPNVAVARSWEITQSKFGGSRRQAIHVDSLAVLQANGTVLQEEQFDWESWTNTCGAYGHWWSRLTVRTATGGTRVDTVAIARPVYSLKYIDRQHGGSEYANENNFIVLRLADVLLIHAEAENELNGPTGAAYASINRVRQRAGVPALSGLSKEQFRAAVWREREHELYGEFQGRFDLVRQGRYLSEMNKGSTVFPEHGICRQRSEHQKLFPIPSVEMAANPRMTQNPGY
jgi:starch-binding outer membrane protein, SusD/RagB family